MDAAHLQNHIRWGMNVAARAIGMRADAYRPRDVFTPLSWRNRYLRLHTSFAPGRGSFAHPVEYGDSLWQGIFDAAYTRPGDYLVREDGTWFIATQQPLLPVLCIRTTRTVSFSRPAGQSAAGINDYGGITASTLVPMMTGWPASVVAGSAGSRISAGLPSDATVPYWTVLLPAIPGCVLRPADIMSDDLGRNAVVGSAELSDLGWRLTVRQAAT
jgi:hypothetical protein